MTNERWLPVVGHEGDYEVSDRGRVRSLDRVISVHGGGQRRCRGVLLQPRPQHTGYLNVRLGRAKQCLVHRLVLEAFEGPCPEGLETLHRDGNPANNWLSNLRYGTRSENNIDVFYQGKRAPTREQILYLRKRRAEGFVYGEQIGLAREWGLTPSMVYAAANGKEAYRSYRHV